MSDARTPAEPLVEAPGEPRVEPPLEQPPEDPKATRKKAYFPVLFVEVVGICVAALVIALLVQAYLVKPFTVHQVSMQPTLHDGDRILLNRLSYRLGEPKVGDIIVLHDPEDSSEDLVKRIVGVANDRIEVKGGKLYRNGVAQNEPYLLEQVIQEDTPEQVVPPGHVFVMGDNRNNSLDSRRFGPISKSMIIGRAFVVYWPLGHWKGL
jgi:signal peptidase I